MKKYLLLITVLTVLGCPLFAQNNDSLEAKVKKLESMVQSLNNKIDQKEQSKIANPFAFHDKNFILNAGYGGAVDGTGVTANLYYWIFGVGYTKSLTSGEKQLDEMTGEFISDRFYDIYSFNVKYALIKKNIFITASFGYYTTSSNLSQNAAEDALYEQLRRREISQAQYYAKLDQLLNEQNKFLSTGYSGGAGILYQYDDKEHKFMDFVMGLEYKSPIGLFFVIGCAF